MPPENQPKINKKTAIIIGVIILILLVAGWFIYKNYQKQKAPAGPSQQELIQKQAKELNTLRQQGGYKPPTPQDIKKQMEELNKLKGQ